ncbi:MAG: hypothetical protein A3E84_00995 [Gammaproteobacteria bacterium RIFCSPHIGHO2_12_FULL_42_13]|nr:MAG: hypothetical protein A3E84_00995 [Gammaproteobacteria bacterium RIFCSPHIGHO2_12_FULL_42_13]
MTKLTLRKCQQKTYLTLIIIFSLPLLSSWFFYQYHDYFHLKTTNHGRLINPPLQVSQLLNLNPQQHRQWHVLVIQDDCSHDQIDTVLYELHQLHLALGENKNRVSLIVLGHQLCKLKYIYEFQKIVLYNQQSIPLSSNNIYLVDPLGNVFMSYPATIDMLSVYTDLKRVLRASQIG